VTNTALDPISLFSKQ